MKITARGAPVEKPGSKEDTIKVLFIHQLMR
jgi:hypothetical protein